MNTCFKVAAGLPRSHMLIYQVMESWGEINATQVYSKNSGSDKLPAICYY